MGEVYSPWRQSRLEPFAAPGIMIPGHRSISVLAGNLSNKDMTVKKNQIVAYLHLYHKDNISGFADFSLLSDLGLPDGVKSVHNVIRRKDLNGLTESQKDEALVFINKYCEVFAKDNFDLGCAVNVQHKITMKDSCPIHSHLSKGARHPKWL